MKTRTSGLLLMTVLLAGCFQKSLHPFHLPGDVVAEPRLAGTWTQETEPDGNRTTWTLTDAGDKRFDVVLQNKEEKHEFDAWMFRLGDDRFLDFQGKARGVSVVPAHHLFKVVELGKGNFTLVALNTDWVHKWVRKNPGSIPHTVVVDPDHRNDREKDEIVLTADTKALQKFVREHMNDQDFFTGPLVLKK